MYLRMIQQCAAKILPPLFSKKKIYSFGIKLPFLGRLCVQKTCPRIGDVDESMLQKKWRWWWWVKERNKNKKKKKTTATTYSDSHPTFLSAVYFSFPPLPSYSVLFFSSFIFFGHSPSQQQSFSIPIFFRTQYKKKILDVLRERCK